MKHNWEYKRLGDVCEILNGYTFKSSEYLSDSGLRVIRISNVQRGYITDEAPQFYPLSYSSQLGKYLLNADDLLMSLTGNIGRVGLLTKDLLPAALNQRVACLRPCMAVIKKFVFYYFNNEYFIDACVKNSRGIAQLNMSTEWLKEYCIPVPPLSEQKRIVEEFDKINEVIADNRKMLNKLNALQQSIFYDMFGDPVSNPKGWVISLMKTFCSFKNGLNYTIDSQGEKIKCLGVGDFKDRASISSALLPYIHISDACNEDYILQNGDIVFVRSNGNKALIGRSLMFINDGDKTTFSGFCIRCRYNDKVVNSKFFCKFLALPQVRKELVSKGRGSNISNLNQQILGSLPVILPPLPLQEEFAAKIEAIETQKANIAETIRKMQTLLDSRMDYWFN